MARAIAVEIVGDASSVNRAFKSASVSAQGFDRSLGHSIRGATAGAGVFRNLGRSLAFASGGFLAFAGITGTLRNSIQGAEALAKAQRALSVAIEHTGASVVRQKPQFEATAKAAAQYGINQADATTALARATELTGNTVKAQRAYQEALVISKATGKDFNQVLTATARGQEGVITSLKRYGILVEKGQGGQAQLNYVMARFGGQAKANTSAIDKFNATWQNTEEILGTALLPTLDRILTRFAAWLTKMQQSGRLQHDVNTAVRDGTEVFHALESVIRGVDKVTGSFLHTLELLAAFKLAKLIGGWSGALTGLIGKWRAVTTAAETAQGAEAGAAAGGLGALAGPLGAVGVGAFLLATSKNKSYRIPGGVISQDGDKFYLNRGGRGGAHQIPRQEALRLLQQAGVVPSGPNAPAPGSDAPRGAAAASLRAQAAANAKLSSSNNTDPIWKKFVLPYKLQLEQQQAALTKGQGDDLKAARDTVAYVRKLLATVRLSHAARLAAISAESSALNTLWSAQDSANKKRTEAAKKAAAEAAKDAAAAKQFNVPLTLQLADARAQALGLSERPILLKMKQAAERALKSGRLGLQGQIDAWNEIANVNNQLKTSTTNALGKFRQASTKALTANLGLSDAQRAALRARLSQLGPNGTVPNKGVGAYGYQIGTDNRPIVIHHTTKLDGKVVARSTTRHQQNHRRRNPTQRRGPNAATGG